MPLSPSIVIGEARGICSAARCPREGVCAKRFGAIKASVGPQINLKIVRELRRARIRRQIVKVDHVYGSKTHPAKGRQMSFANALVVIGTPRCASGFQKKTFYNCFNELL